MKSRTPFFILIGLIVLAVSITLTLLRQAQEPAQTFAATVTRDCAPWDGAAFTVRIPLNTGAVIDISIWKSPNIKSSTTFTFPDNTGQVGNAILIHSIGLPDALTGTVQLEGVSEGQTVGGRFSFMSERGGIFEGSFTAQWDNQIILCG